MAKFIGELNIRTDRCKGCELCVEACNREVLALAEALNQLGYHPVVTVNPEACNGCGNCAVMCPDCVITVEKRDAA